MFNFLQSRVKCGRILLFRSISNKSKLFFHQIFEIYSKNLAFKSFSTSKQRVEKPKLTFDIFKSFPKAELHQHFDGSIRPNSILELAKEQKIELPTYDLNKLSKLICLSEGTTSLVEFLKAFDITLLVLQTPYSISRTIYEVCQDASRDGVRYLELRFSPILHTQRGMSLSQVMKAVCEGLIMAEIDLPITCRIIICGMRHLDSSVTEKLAEIAWRYQSSGVVGFDLAGPEEGFSSKSHKKAFDIVRKNNLNCTLHSGEAAGAESIRDSVRYCGTNRIGHGVRLRENAELMKYFVDHGITIESCVTSNLQTKAVNSLQDHPIKQYYDYGIKIVPCTDNTAISDTTLSKEYQLIYENFDFSVEDILRLINNGFDGAFLPPSMKKELRSYSLRSCINILHQHGIKFNQLEDLNPDNKLAFYFSELRPDWDWTNEINNNPPLTQEILKNIPKADLHTRLDGSVSVNTLWNEFQFLPKAKQQELVPDFTFSKFEEFLSFYRSLRSLRDIRKIVQSLLQTKSQLENALEDIIKEAVSEGVIYIEIMVRPTLHTNEGLSSYEVVQILLNKKKQLEELFPITLGFVLFSNPLYDDLTSSQVMAKVATHFKDKGVVGSGFLGAELTSENFQTFVPVFDYLKDHDMNIVITAGTHNSESINEAIHVGGAHRVNRAFQLHTNPSLLNYLATHNIAIELGVTEKAQTFLSELQTFAGSPIRLYLDNGVPVTLCSFHSKFPEQLGQTRLDTLERVINEAKLSVSEVLHLSQIELQSSFLPFRKKNELMRMSWNKSVEYLTSKGFHSFYHNKQFKK